MISSIVKPRDARGSVGVGGCEIVGKGSGMAGPGKLLFASDSSQDLCRPRKINGFAPMDGGWEDAGGKGFARDAAAVRCNVSATNCLAAVSRRGCAANGKREPLLEPKTLDRARLSPWQGLDT
jgi:hypothetical protein